MEKQRRIHITLLSLMKRTKVERNNAQNLMILNSLLTLIMITRQLEETQTPKEGATSN